MGRHVGELRVIALAEETKLEEDAREGSLPVSVGLGRHGYDAFEEACLRTIRAQLHAVVEVPAPKPARRATWVEVTA